jgi:hypothetical protein
MVSRQEGYMSAGDYKNQRMLPKFKQPKSIHTYMRTSIIFGDVD